MLFKKEVLFEVSYFARNMYETEAVTSGLCYIEIIIFLENNMSSQPIVQLNYIIYFQIGGSFFNIFLRQFLEKSA